MKLVAIHNNYYHIPEDWNELTNAQLLQVIKLFENQEQFIGDAQVELLKIISGIGWRQLWWHGYAAIEDKLYLSEFLLTKNTLTKNLLPEYHGLFGPADDFDNLKVKEFVFSELYYTQYKESKETTLSDLNMLIAVLYRPAKAEYDRELNPSGDVREEFNENVSGHYASKIQHWPLHVKKSILHWYEGCRSGLEATNQEIFSGSSGEPAQYGLWSVMRGVAEKGIHGNINQVENMYVKVFMMELNELLAESKKLKAAAKT